MKLTAEKLLLLKAKLVPFQLFTEVVWREWVLEQWVEKTRRVSHEKANYFIAGAARIKEIQLTGLN